MNTQSTIKAYVPFRQEIATILGHQNDNGNIYYSVAYKNLSFKEQILDQELKIMTLVGVNENPLSTQLTCLTGDSFNSIDFAKNESKAVQGLFFLTHKASRKQFRCMAQELEKVIYATFLPDYKTEIDGIKYVMVWDNGTCLMPVRNLEEHQIVEILNRNQLKESIKVIPITSL